MACKEDDSASLVIYRHTLVFKDTYEVALNHSLKFLPELVFYLFFYEGRLAAIPNGHRRYSENPKQGGLKLRAKFRFSVWNENNYKNMKVIAHSLIREQKEK